MLFSMKTSKEEREVAYYKYDAAGNQTESKTITSKTPLTVGEYRDAALTAQEFADKNMDALTYDLEGREILQGAPVSKHRTTKVQKREYNSSNQLVLVEQKGDAVVYCYRPDGLRHSKTVEGKTTIHHWDGQNMVLESTGTGRRE